MENPNYPSITVWQVWYPSGVLHATVYKEKLIANELIKKTTDRLFHFQPKDPRVWVLITDPLHQLQDQGIYCISYINMQHTVKINGPTSLVVHLNKKFTYTCTGKDLFDELDVINPNLRLCTQSTRDSAKTAKTEETQYLPSYEITKETNLPLVGSEYYRFSNEPSPGKPEPTKPTKRKCMDSK
jgi:hypothetical protein